MGQDTRWKKRGDYYNSAVESAPTARLFWDPASTTPSATTKNFNVYKLTLINASSAVVNIRIYGPSFISGATFEPYRMTPASVLEFNGYPTDSYEVLALSGGSLYIYAEN